MPVLGVGAEADQGAVVAVMLGAVAESGLGAGIGEMMGAVDVAELICLMWAETCV